MFLFLFIGILPYAICFKGDVTKFYKYCYEKYGDVHEITGNLRSIVLYRAEHLENLLSKSTHGMRCQNHEGLKELGIEGKGITLINIKMVVFIKNDMIIKLLTDKKSCSMEAYFDTLSDEKSDHQSSARVEDSISNEKLLLI
ncbi:hypothetical protein RhiirC2_856590 [Rhizophagus irregularis]|uniref:Uncharacterized protein n=1 Tax=Rhizophagus irregularis TaxID=588596 RepID=A0A2N1MH13_9GLOM|nr:hypothetical protein RhiirC2_856590 [Rhizophagus irregularis]